MWLGAAAGLALLTWSTVYASTVSLDDQHLIYEGAGWQVGTGPQTCSKISPTVHTTSTTGDFVTQNFTGNAVYVLGPLTTLSNPTTVILDGDVQPVAAPIQGYQGCGILYSNTNLGVQQHTITLVFSAASGSVQFSISGIIVFTTDPATSVAPSSTLLQVLPTTFPTDSSNSTSTTTTFVGSTPAAGTTTVANAAPPQPPLTSPPATPSSTQSVVSTSAFVTTTSMTVTLIVAIFGTIIAMLGVLAIFILLRRRITRNAARKRDQENSFGREARETEEGDGEGQKDAGLPLWSVGGKGGDVTQFIMETGPLASMGTKMDTPYASVVIPPPVASGSGTRHLSVLTTSVQRTSAAMSYTVPLGASLLAHSPVSVNGDGDDYLYSPQPKPPSITTASHVRTLTPLSIPIFLSTHSRVSSSSHTPTPPGLPTSSRSHSESSFDTPVTLDKHGGLPNRSRSAAAVGGRTNSRPNINDVSSRYI